MKSTAASRQVRTLWRQWFNVVLRSAKSGRPGVSPAKYEELHRDLMDSFKIGKRSFSGNELITLTKLEKIASPWISLASIDQADPEVLEHLVERCQKLERGWANQGLFFSHDWLKSMIVAGVLALLAFVVVQLVVGHDNRPADWVQTLQEQALSIRFSIVRASLFQKIAGVTFVLVLIAMRLMVFKR